MFYRSLLVSIEVFLMQANYAQPQSQAPSWGVIKRGKLIKGGRNWHQVMGPCKVHNDSWLSWPVGKSARIMERHGVA